MGCGCNSLRVAQWMHGGYTEMCALRTVLCSLFQPAGQKSDQLCYMLIVENDKVHLLAWELSQNRLITHLNS